jgi:hypothetical protein
MVDGLNRESWFQLLQDELKEYNDDHLWHWPIEWWNKLLQEGMDPVQAVLYTIRLMHKMPK